MGQRSAKDLKVTKAESTEERELPEIDLSKVEANVGKHEGSSKKLIVLLSSGSFAPVHRAHVTMFDVARTAAERAGDTIVVGGFLAPSSEHYVHCKLGKDAISLEHRVSMCKLAVAGSDWLDVCDWGMANGATIARMLDLHFERKMKAKQIATIQILGADTMLRFHAWEHCSEPFIILGRPGYTEEIKRRYAAAEEPNKNLIFADGELDDVSSTAVRKAIRENDEAALAKLLHPGVARFMLEVIRPIFLTQEQPKETDLA